jgi:hypothetical protein
MGQAARSSSSQRIERWVKKAHGHDNIKRCFGTMLAEGAMSRVRHKPQSSRVIQSSRTVRTSSDFMKIRKEKCEECRFRQRSADAFPEMVRLGGEPFSFLTAGMLDVFARTVANHGKGFCPKENETA